MANGSAVRGKNASNPEGRTSRPAAGLMTTQIFARGPQERPYTYIDQAIMDRSAAIEQQEIAKFHRGWMMLPTCDRPSTRLQPTENVPSNAPDAERGQRHMPRIAPLREPLNTFIV